MKILLSFIVTCSVFSSTAFSAINPTLESACQNVPDSPKCWFQVADLITRSEVEDYSVEDIEFVVKKLADIMVVTGDGYIESTASGKIQNLEFILSFR